MILLQPLFGGERKIAQIVHFATATFIGYYRKIIPVQYNYN